MKRRIIAALAIVALVVCPALADKYIGNLDADTIDANTAQVKTLKIGGDPLNGTVSTEITATAAELNTACDGITATAAELNTVADGITATAAELNTVADGITATATEINTACDGITATAAELNILDGATNTYAQLNAMASGSAAGTVVAAVGTAVEYGMPTFHQTIITITNTANPTELADGADGEGVKIYDFPDGVIKIHGVTISGVVVTNEGNFNASDDDHYYIALGTTEAASGDDDLTALEANLIAKTTLDTAAGVTTAHTNSTFLATTVIVDGTSTACDIWLNASIEASDNSAANTVGFTTGVVTVTWSNLGDY